MFLYVFICFYIFYFLDKIIENLIYIKFFVKYINIL